MVPGGLDRLPLLTRPAALDVRYRRLVRRPGAHRQRQATHRSLDILDLAGRKGDATGHQHQVPSAPAAYRSRVGDDDQAGDVPLQGLS